MGIGRRAHGDTGLRAPRKGTARARVEPHDGAADSWAATGQARVEPRHGATDCSDESATYGTARARRPRGSDRLWWAALVMGTVGLSSACSIPRWPVEGSLVSPYGLRWRGLAPDLHKGVDISVPEGTEVRAMIPGVVRFAGTMRGYGNVVMVDHNARLTTVYAHLSRILVREGERLNSRRTVGLSGRTGNATSPLLHFEIRRWGRERDPVALLGGPP